jgi:virginiamycin B lyase
MRRLVSILAALALCAALVPVSAGAKGAPPPRTQLTHLREGTEVEALAVGAEGYLWFAGQNHGPTPSNVVGRISPGGAVDEFTVQNTATVLGVGGLTRGPEGDMWFTEPSADRIERVSPAGHPEGFTLPVTGSRPTGIVGAPGGYLWVTLEGTGKVGQVDPAGTFREISLPAGARPTSIALGPDSALWAVERESATLRRISLQGGTATYPLPTSGKIFQGALDSDIATGPDGNLWLSQEDGPFVATVIPTQTQPEYVRYEVPLEEGEGTTLIAPGPNEDLWFATNGGAIGSISPLKGEVGDVGCPLTCAAPIAALAEGPEGALWFASGETIGTFRPSPLFIVREGRMLIYGKKLKIPFECRGGAAGQKCKGSVEVLPLKGKGKKPFGHGRLSIPTMTAQKATIHLTARATRRAKAKGHLMVRLVVKLGGKLSSTRVPIYHARG